MIQPRPSMPGMAYVAGIQIKAPKALPLDIQVSPSKPPYESNEKRNIYFEGVHGWRIDGRCHLL